MEIGYTKTTKKSFDEAVNAVEQITASRGFRVLHTHDVQNTLREKGFVRGPFKIIEICNSKFAYEALETSVDVGLFMPCKINVFTRNGETVISAMRPAIISQFFPQPQLKALADEVDTLVRKIVDEAR